MDFEKVALIILADMSSNIVKRMLLPLTQNIWRKVHAGSRITNNIGLILVESWKIP